MGYLSCKAESTIAVHNPSKKSDKIHGNEDLIHKKIQHFDYSDLEAATNNFSDQKLLGRGRLVAVKKPSHQNNHHSALSAVPENEVENEIDILSKLHSPRLCSLLTLIQ
ncbi:Protein kinase-like domain-containing protein [Cynara cardunculus var. scolymus]|uniref:Protein kinase-like domain-containing protein n=1 Tax=Cynara cardunculus var. scolymus TaxID=59895 RepID=A0A103XRM8_CYNCS|nr:Protein kinase-like domain-containing protein [Cynara cardunculus var. scolymus]